jgi:hypothetical protein
LPFLKGGLLFETEIIWGPENKDSEDTLPQSQGEIWVERGSFRHGPTETLKQERAHTLEGPVVDGSTLCVAEQTLSFQDYCRD